MDLVTNVVKQSLNPQRALLLLHGYGADERDLAALAPYLDPEGRLLIVCPRGPEAVAGAGFSWYDMGAEEPGAAGVGAVVDALDDLLDSVCVENQLDRSDAIVAGFSQGASLAYALGYRISARPRPVAVAALSSFLLEDVPGLAYAWG